MKSPQAIRAGIRISIRLTPQEVEIIRLLAQGVKGRVIAQEVGVSLGTLKARMPGLYSKVGVRDRIELIIWAAKHGLV